MVIGLEQYDAPAISREQTASRLYDDGGDSQRLKTTFVSFKSIESKSQNINFENDDFSFHGREKKELLDIVDRAIPENKRTIFKKAMEQFENRASTDGVGEDQVEATYAQLRRIASSSSDLLPKNRRLALIEQILNKAADPTTIDQGEHGTCGAAVVEVRTYWRSPEKAAKLVADAALTGEVMTPRGVPLLIDVQPHDTSKNFEMKNGQRSHASELFQVAAINLSLNTAPNVVPGSIAFRQMNKPKDGSGSGEVVIDYSQHPPVEKKFGGLQVDQVLRINQIVAGRAEKDIVLWRADKHDPREIGKVFTNEIEMEKAIVSAKKSGALPVILFVHTGNEPLWKDSPINIDGGKGAWHFINITDIDNGLPRKVSVDSTWWKNADHGKEGEEGISISDLYVASLSPKEAEKTLSKRDEQKFDVAANTGKDISLVRQKWIAGSITADQLEKSLGELAENAKTRWNKEAVAGIGDRNEQFKSIKTLMEAVDRLPSENKIRLLDKLCDQGYLRLDEYQAGLIASAIELNAQKKIMVADGDFNRKAEEAFIKAEKQYLTQLNALTEAQRNAVIFAVKNRQMPDDKSFFAKRTRDRDARRNSSRHFNDG